METTDKGSGTAVDKTIDTVSDKADNVPWGLSADTADVASKPAEIVELTDTAYNAVCKSVYHSAYNSVETVEVKCNSVEIVEAAYDAAETAEVIDHRGNAAATEKATCKVAS